MLYRAFPERASIGPAVARKPPLLKSPISGSWTWTGLPDWLRRILDTNENDTFVLFYAHLLCVLYSFATYLPQNFLMPLWLFLFSGETGDCCPESTPEDSGDWSERIYSSSFPAWSDRHKKHKVTINAEFYFVFLDLVLAKNRQLGLKDKKQPVTKFKLELKSIFYSSKTGTLNT